MNEEPGADAPPCWPTLMACSLALMTAHACPDPASTLDAAGQRRLIARKIVSNLFFLRHHPHAPQALRQVAANMHALWVPLAHPADAGAPHATTAPPALTAPPAAPAAAAPDLGPAWLH